jgi:hypothetical protein
VPIAETRTHVLLDAWYSAKTIWKAARDRGFLITTGLKSNRSIRVADEAAPGGWRWQDLAWYAAGLTDADYQETRWPRQDGSGRTVWVHVVRTVVQHLYRAQVIIVRELRDGKLTEPRLGASSDLAADTATLIDHLAARWDIEVLFADTKELLGLDQYQIMSATALVRFWTLVLAAYVFLEEERAALQQDWQRHVSIGETQREVQRVHWFHLITWMQQQLWAGQTPATLFRDLAA